MLAEILAIVTLVAWWGVWLGGTIYLGAEPQHRTADRWFGGIMAGSSLLLLLIGHVVIAYYQGGYWVWPATLVDFVAAIVAPSLAVVLNRAMPAWARVAIVTSLVVLLVIQLGFDVGVFVETGAAASIFAR